MEDKNNHLLTVLLVKTTVFSFFCPLLILICLLYVVYLALFRQQAYETPFTILFLLFTIVILGVLWGLDRVLVNSVRPGVLSAVELVLISSLGLWFSYSKREFIIDASATSGQTFIVAYTIDDTLAEKPDPVFPFSQKITISDRNYVIVRDVYRLSEKNSFSPLLKPPASWGGSWRKPGIGIDVQDSRFIDFDIYLDTDRQSPLSLDEEERITKAKVEKAINDFLDQVKK